MPEMICFVIAPIGEEGSEVRKRSDRVFNYLIEPAARVCGYKAVRADKISKPGIITMQVLQEVINAPMAVADLSGHNANAFYELAVRHMVKKPLVQMITKGEKIPFDVAASRVLYYDEPELETVERTQAELVEHIRSAEGGAVGADNPISVSVDLQALKASSDPLGVQLGQLADAVSSSLAAIRADISELRKEMNTAPHSDIFRSLLIERPAGGLTVGQGLGRGLGLNYNVRSADFGGTTKDEEKKP